jgi:hypothetical protein
MSHESDPLLPRDKSAPEIHGSRPQSTNDIDDREASIGAGDSDQVYVPGRRGLTDAVALFTGFITLALVLFIVFPDSLRGVGGGLPTPRTIEERVARILTDTPLIGNSAIQNLNKYGCL